MGVSASLSDRRRWVVWTLGNFSDSVLGGAKSLRSSILFRRGTRTLSCLDRRFFVMPATLMVDAEPENPIRVGFGIWKSSSSRKIAAERALMQV